jgi:NAD(P)-dependent dehydrogenase (short-subunit alcohol dehydrogenase family)
MAANTNQSPRSIRNILSTPRNKALVVSGVISGLIGGKKLINGPNFNEEVDLTGKTVVITGANTGLGKESAIKLIDLGAQVILLCKNEQRGRDAIEDIRKQTQNKAIDSLEIVPLDLANLDSVQRCAKSLKERLDKIDVLMLNAGIMAIPERRQTKDGFEMHIGVNHLGHFALTGQLIDLLKKSSAARVVTVSSAAHLLGKKTLVDDLNFQNSKYEPWLAYGNSKLANILFTRELTEKIKSSKDASNILPLVCHPGACRTELSRYIFDLNSIPKALAPLLGVAISPLVYFTKSAKEGAQTQVFLAASQSIQPSDAGMYYDNSAPASTSNVAQDQKLWKELWKQSESLTGVKYNI